MAPSTRGKLTRSLEDYLEAIWRLVRAGRAARVRDIACAVGVQMPSVTAALKGLSRRGLVNYDPYELVTLTERGREAAAEIAARHRVLREFLADVLGLDDQVAEDNACRMEHAADAEMLERLGQFVEFVRSCPRAGEDWLKAFAGTCRDGSTTRRCRRCAARPGEKLARARPGRTRKAEAKP